MNFQQNRSKTVGHVRVVNLRGDGITIEADETPIRVDRASRIFGNPFHIERRGDMAARMHVLMAYQNHLAKDLRERGPISKEIKVLAERLNNGENLALQCWCAPLPCHGDHLVRVIREESARLQNSPGNDVSHAECDNAEHFGARSLKERECT